MNLFLFDDDTVPLPPVTTSQAVQRVLSVFDALARGLGPAPPVRLRSREEVLVEAKAVDERVRTGEQLPLVGILVAEPSDPVVTGRLTQAGAVVAGHVESGFPISEFEVRLETLSKLDALFVTEPPKSCRDAVGFVPTRGLIPLRAAGPGTVLARDAAIAQQVAAAITGPDPRAGDSRGWPDSVRLGTGDHPRIGVADGGVLTGIGAAARTRLRNTANTLRVAGAVTSAVDLGDVEGWCLRRTAFALREHDALLVPLGGGTRSLPRLLARLDASAVLVPIGGSAAGEAVAMVTRPFDDQVALDLAGLLTGSQAPTPYPDIGVGLVAFGAYLRGQPRADALTRVGARFTGFVTTMRRYRLMLFGQDPPEAGVVVTKATGVGGPLLGERWLLSPNALGEFVARLPSPMRLGTVDVSGGESSLAILCDDVVAEYGEDITSWECWRAYLRHLSALKPVAARVGS